MMFLFNFRYVLAAFIDDIVLIIPVQSVAAYGRTIYIVIGSIGHYYIDVYGIACLHLLFLRSDG